MKKIVAVFAACLFCFVATISTSAYYQKDVPYYEPPRPDGYHECIGDILALKLSLTDDPDYKYLVAIDCNFGALQVYGEVQDVPGIVNYVNRIYDANIDKFSIMKIGFYGNVGIQYYLKLTGEQIDILTKLYDKLIKEAEGKVYYPPFRLYYVGTGGTYKTNLYNGKLENLTEAQFCELRGDGFTLHHDGINSYAISETYHEVFHVYPEVKQPETTMLVICMIVAGCAALLSLVAAIFSILSCKKANRCSTDEH